MKGFDISVIICVYGDTLALAPTVASVKRAVAHAQAGGLRVECLLVSRLDRHIAAWFAEHVPGGWTFVEASDPFVGAARQAGVAASSGAFIAMIDAGDMWSKTWLSDAHLLAKDAATASVWHPEIVFRMGNYYFDGRFYWTQFQLDTSGAQVQPGDLLAAEPYADGGFAPRELVERVPFPVEDFARGWAHVDWWWACNVAEAGYNHRTVKGAFLYRLMNGDGQPFGKPVIPPKFRIGPIMRVSQIVQQLQ